MKMLVRPVAVADSSRVFPISTLARVLCSTTASDKIFRGLPWHAQIRRPLVPSPIRRDLRGVAVWESSDRAVLDEAVR